jgi:hypothetical protein
MCRQIVELHGGRITCTAGEQDRGARIAVELPVDRSSQSIMVPDESTPFAGPTIREGR